MIAAAEKLSIINRIQRIIAFKGSVTGIITTNGSNGSLNKLCIKNTAKEYFENTFIPL